jgi:hypothetical protein
LGRAFAHITPRLNADDARALTDRVTTQIKGTLKSSQLTALLEIVAAIAPRMEAEQARLLVGPVVEAIEYLNYDNEIASQALVAVARHLPWSERLELFAFALKCPTVYGKSRDVLVAAIMEHPEAKIIHPQTDVWAVAEWLKGQRGIDLTKAPQRTKAITP